MRLYVFEHCSLCFRVRMTAALKRLHLQETVVLDDDSDTLLGLVGKRQIPILVKDDGIPMLESMDMVRYLDAVGQSGQVMSRHYDDALPLWAAGKHRRMRMDRAEVDKGAIGHLRLTPSKN